MRMRSSAATVARLPHRGVTSTSVMRGRVHLTVALILAPLACAQPKLAPSSVPVAAPLEARAAGARITVLYDAFGQRSDMQKDWGYSALVEYGGRRILFDTGNDPEILAGNARTRGVDLSKLDF